MNVEVAATSLFMRGIDKLIEKVKPKEIQKVQVVQEQVSFVDSKITRINSTNTKRQETPDFEVKNPRNTDVKIKRISVIPDSAFKTKGRLVVTVNDVKIFSDLAVTDWTDVTIFEIHLDVETQILQHDRSIKFFIWTSDGTAINLTITYVIAS